MAKAIKITQEIKDKNAKYGLNFIKNNPLNSIVSRSLPNKFHVTEPVSGGYLNRTDLHELDGWKDIIVPRYNSETQRLGNQVIEVGNDYTYEVIDLTDAEIQQRLINTSQAQKDTLIQKKIEADIVAEAQNSDDTTSLDNQALFPMWEVPFDYTVDFKCQHFTSDNELVLYKCIQAHTSQEDWQPKDVPALFVRVAYPNEIPVWVQPTGAHDAYNIGDQVLYPDENGSVFESLIDANVWSPQALPSAWQLIS